MADSVYKKFESNAISSNRELVSAPLWSDSATVLTKIYTSSQQTIATKRYYYEVYNSQSTAQNAQVQFSIAYGDSKGSGSSTGSVADDYDYPTQAIYSQYKQMLLPIGVNEFTFANDETSEHVYVINVNRSRYKDRMDTNTWQLCLVEMSASGEPSSSNRIIKLIDDSGTATTDLAQQGGRTYYIRSGSLTDGIYTNDTTPWGIYYPDNGIIVLNGKALDASASFTSSRSFANPTSSFLGDNSAYKLFTSISGAMSISSSFGFQGRTSEVVSSTYYFARIYSEEFNYSNNKSFVTSSNAIKRYFVQDPTTYITTIGMYDNNNELLAVAKLSKPIKKTFDREIVVKIKLDY